MGVGSELQELGRFLDDCERQSDAVQCFDVAAVTDVGDHRLAADLELTVSLTSARGDPVGLSDPRVGPDGTVRFALDATSDLPTDTDHDVAVEPTAATLNGDGTATVTLAATVPEDGELPETSGSGDADSATAVGTSNDDASAADHESAPTGPSTAVGPSATESGGFTDSDDDGELRTEADTEIPAEDESELRVDDESELGAEEEESELRVDDTKSSATEPTRPSECDVPPFEDRELLADVYESCETFSAMADALPMNVTGETVRRYMIDHDIHEPTTYQTSDDDPQPVVLSDGIGLPDDVTVDTLVETVRTSNTIYQVKQDIDVDREDALEMLQELNLLDLVVGRLATEGEREITHDDVVECLREASAVE